MNTSDWPELGIGTWAWGDSWYWGYNKGYSESDVYAAFQASLESGITFFDTAESYGMGQSERLLGQFMRRTETPITIATKFAPFPWRLRGADLLRALRKSLQRLGVEQIDLYQIHFPYSPRPTTTWVKGLADAVEAGLVRRVGVSNFSPGQMRRAFETLAERRVLLASNQVEYNLLNRGVERNGLLDLCRELGIMLIAYSPLAQGMLSGRYTPQNPPSGLMRRYRHPGRLVKAQPLIGLLREIGTAHGGKTPAQVAINWVICKGALPIPGAKNADQVRHNAGAIGWRLAPDEVAALDQASG
jgi:aryl-alcohol dehydrogenase-like predicted oxidoreductase